ncbi:MAG: hypothetical protein A2506_09150 [Elusimicrobia bacterium RIFOXYD12_FULL_66_9]|nr:MAG: hypothetical protein A2506_09150 [Elusimicrobia bacterium RIFOXYD12_FULL_66_9]
MSILPPVLAAALAACGGVTVIAPDPVDSSSAAGEAVEKKVDPQITTTLVRLAEERGSFKRDLSESAGTPVGDLLLLGSPIGYNLRNRFLDLGLPLSEAFSANADPVFRQQLIEMARWDKDSESRASALIALARSHDLAHLRVINEALIHLNPGVRFGALEALVVWGHPREAMPLLAAASERDTEPLLRVYAAAGLTRLGDPAGLHRLRQFLDDPSWLVKAMAAKYLGELGTAEDYDILLNRLDREVSNDFVVAEYCVAALKLYPQKRKP